MLLTLTSVAKTFGNKTAVADVSFEVRPGEIFGLLGPNGAGKTTTIRMILDLIKPDQGRIDVLGGALTERSKERIGYMPEDAGLYGEMRLRECLIYLAMLKGLARSEAQARVEKALVRFDLTENQKKRVRELSRGMYQKAQIIAATVHEPDLLIVDEPFANLDPVNVQITRDLLLEMRARGKSVLMTSHQLYLVEALCDRIALIHQGRVVLYGPVRAVKRQFADHAVWVEGAGAFDTLPSVQRVEKHDHRLKLWLAAEATPSEVWRQAATQSDFHLDHFELALPSLEEIFVRVVGQGERSA